jgi:hypothetical protein
MCILAGKKVFIKDRNPDPPCLALTTGTRDGQDERKVVDTLVVVFFLSTKKESMMDKQWLVNDVQLSWKKLFIKDRNPDSLSHTESRDKRRTR